MLNVLLQLLDDGRLTDGQGRTVDFKNTLIIMTSNLGSDAILEFGDRDHAEMESLVQRALRQHFRPEFLNRLDETVIFRQLSREQIRHIVGLHAESLQKLLHERGMTLVLTDSARDALADEGYDPHYGARPLKRTLQRRIQNPLAMKLLEGAFKPGDTVEITYEGGSYQFRTAKPARTPEKAHA